MPHSPGVVKGSTYCPVSRRIEGTVHMDGKKCSFCHGAVTKEK